MDIQKCIEEIMEEHGVEYVNGQISTVIDSLQFVSIMIAIEDRCEVEFTENMITPERFVNFDRLVESVKTLRENK